MTAESPLDSALRQFEAVEANLVKLQQIWNELRAKVPDGLSFGSDAEYEQRCREFHAIVEHLPAIDAWKITHYPLDLNAIGQARFDAREIDEISAIVSVEEEVESPGRDLAEYRFRFDRKRRELVRNAVQTLMNRVDEELRAIERLLPPGVEDPARSMAGTEVDRIKDAIAQIDVLLGSSVSRPPRWPDLLRHLRFAQAQDIREIILVDWPPVKTAVTRNLYGEREAIPVAVADLGDLVVSQPRGRVATKLEWARLNAEDFERLMFTLISSEPGYENPEWLTKTTAPDRGRDLSVTRVSTDALSGTGRRRVIVQCRHSLDRSVTVADVAELKEQMKLWQPPRVDVLVIATTGRFSSDAIRAIEVHNQGETGLHIEMWPETHIERLLAARPGFISEFRLK